VRTDLARRILITGASRGIGLALAAHYVERGDTVFGASRGESAIDDPRYTHVRADVSSEADVEALFAAIRGGGLDVVVNNAGLASMNAIALTTADALRRVVDASLVGTFLCTRAAIRLLRSSACARIVNVTSVAVPLRLEGEAAYASAKAAVETFTRISARELAPFGITCNAVGPSPVRTKLTESVPDAKIARLLERQAIRRWAEPADVINVVDFFLRPESGLVTGQVVYLGGAG
jgi:3-oxoacyl-[acyl-carrier protein] reductase